MEPSSTPEAMTLPTTGDLVISLGELGNSGQTGVAVFSAKGDNTELALFATDAISELNHIHARSCAELGGVEHGLTNMAGGMSVTTVEATLESLQTGCLAINLHKAGEPGIYTSCGNIPNQNESMTISLEPTGNSGQTGVATLTARGDKTEVVLLATPGISELNHIHAGSCTELGGVEHGLANMAGGMSVTLVDAPLASLRTGGLAINLHKASEPGVYTSCGDIPAGTAVNVGEDPGLGTILTDSSGRTLYLFINDQKNVSNCAGGCAAAWPPLITVVGPTPGEGVDGGLLGTITREDGSAQITYNGWPLYYYAADEKPGDATGEDRGGVWFTVSPAGGPVVY